MGQRSSFCPNCGTGFAYGETHCPYCGRMREVVDTRPLTAAEQKRASADSNSDRALGLQNGAPQKAFVMDLHLMAYSALRRRNMLWMPTWVWVALLAILCLSVGLFGGVLLNATQRIFPLATPLPGWSTPPTLKNEGWQPQRFGRYTHPETGLSVPVPLGPAPTPEPTPAPEEIAASPTPEPTPDPLDSYVEGLKQKGLEKGPPKVRTKEEIAELQKPGPPPFSDPPPSGVLTR